MSEKGCPVILKLSGRLCVIAGGGRGAVIKARTLIRSGARLRIIADTVSDELEGMGAEIVRRRWMTGDAEGAFLVFALTGDDKTDNDIKREAKNAGALEGGEDIRFPACAEGENIRAFVSTGYPKLSARLMRDILRYDEICGLLKAFREEVNGLPADHETRGTALEAAVTDEALEAARLGAENYKEYLDRIRDRFLEI